MESQLSLFEEKAGAKALDIRTEQQSSRKVAYDAGVKLMGSKKEMARLRKEFENCQTKELLEEIEGYSSAMAADIITKYELFKGFSLENEKEKGTEPAVARFKQLLLQRVSAVPSIDSKEGRTAFLHAAQYLIQTTESVTVWDHVTPFFNTISDLVRYEKSSNNYYENRIFEYKDVLSSLKKGTEEYEITERKYKAYQEYLIKSIQAKEMTLSILGVKFSKFFQSSASYSSTLTSAMKVNSWDELLAPKVKKASKERKPVWERTLPERPDRKGGAQTPVQKPEDAITFFGFKAIEFGHYVSDSKGTEHLIRSTEAMLDLAELLGVDYRSISLDGTLSISYGSRGRGNAMAHYEPLTKVINMTKEKGYLGIFSHEWYHALEHFIFNSSHDHKNGRSGYSSEPNTLGLHISSSIKLAFEDLMDSIKKGNSVSYFENTNTPSIRWRGTEFKVLYRQYNGDLKKTMERKVQLEKSRLEDRLLMSSYYSYSDKEKEKLQKRYEKEIKNFALALAWFHEQETGVRVDTIPYPSNKSKYLQASISLDKGKIGKYWSSNCELAARAFESFIQDRLKADERVSDYLVAGTRDGAAFPMGEERKEINEKFEYIFQLLKEHEII
jgi:hypothetical protein